MEWQLENEVLAELIWAQDFDPLNPDPYSTTNLQNQKDAVSIDLQSFDLISCSTKAESRKMM